MNRSIAIKRVGMCTAVGLNAPAASAAIRVGITGFRETKFMFDGEWQQGAEVPMEKNWRGREKLLRMSESVVRECIGDATSNLQNVPLVLNLAEATRPGRLAGLDDSFLQELMQRVGATFHPDSRVIQNGRVGGVQAVDAAVGLLDECPACLVVGVDSFFNGRTLRGYYDLGRLLTPVNSDGFIPGEAAGAVWLERVEEKGSPELTVCGRGYGTEASHITSEEPLKGFGLADAIRAAIQDGGVGFEALDYRICDANGEQYLFKEGALAMARTFREDRDQPDIWHNADCIGEVGAATIPCALAVAWAAAHKQYAPGDGVITHVGNDDGQRAAMTLRFEQEERSAA